MKKIGIITCFKMSRTCAGRFCFDAMASGSDSFAAHLPEGFQLVGFGHCNECCSSTPEDIRKKAGILRAAGAEVIHLGSCIQKICPNHDTFQEILSRDLEVVPWTHRVPYAGVPS